MKFHVRCLSFPIRFAFGTLLTLLILSSHGHDESPSERADFHSGVDTTGTPWTHLNFQNDPNNFQFAIVTDRTGSPRSGVFEDAVEKLNWLQPEFVMSVGDLIQGTSENGDTNAAQWDEFLEWLEPLEMPFFFLAGNHDIQAKWVEGRVPYEVMREQWEERFGTTYYYYIYKNVLFVALFTNDGVERHISEEQVAYFKTVLEKHVDVRWTMVFLHHPLWDSPHDSNFHEIESILEGRDYSVFAGHQHMYRHFERKNSNYYVLATTGGGSPLRGEEFGEFDHITWITMTDDGPVLANIRLDGILPHDVTNSEVKAYSSLLTMSATIDSSVVLEESDRITGGVAYLTFRNRSPFSIRYHGSFFHNHFVHPSPGNLDLTLDPQSSETIAVEFVAMESFKSSDRVKLEFDGAIGFVEEDIPNLEMSGTQGILLRNSKIELIGSESIAFSDSTTLSFEMSPEVGEIRYTTDGSIPSSDSIRYSGPIGIEEGGVVNARLYSGSGIASEVDSVRLIEVGSGIGLLCDYYEYEKNPAFAYSLPNFDTLTPTLTQVVSEIDPGLVARREESFGLVYRGFIDLPEDGEYTFHLESDDGARLIVDDKTVVDDPLKHPVREVSGSARFVRGKKAIELQYFQHKQKMRIGLSYTLPSGTKMHVPPSSFSYGE